MNVSICIINNIFIKYICLSKKIKNTYIYVVLNVTASSVWTLVQDSRSFWCPAVDQSDSPVVLGCHSESTGTEHAPADSGSLSTVSRGEETQNAGIYE